MNKRAALLIAGAGMLAQSCGQSLSYSYNAAMYTSVAGVSQELEVFPLDAESFSIPMPFPLGAFAYSHDGKVLYASALGFTPPGLFKIELDPFRVSPVSGSTALGFDSLVVSADQQKVVIAGGGRGAPCGIFELNSSDGNVRKIAESFPCTPLDPVSQWFDLNVSPDGTRATARRNHHLELIDLVTGSVEPFVDGFELGAWSPDGKWLAAVKHGSDETVLLDGRTFAQRRSLGSIDLNWSPDSRYLLNKKFDFRCGLSEVGTLEMVNVETGQRTEIKSSRCLIDRNTIGWVSSGIKRPRSPNH